MLDFVASVFRGFVNFILWVILLLFIIGGFLIGGNVFGGWGFSIGYAFLGLIIGGFLGLITVISSGGLIANFLNLVDNVETIKHQLAAAGNSSSGISTKNLSPLASIRRQEEKRCNRCKRNVSSGFSACPHCGSNEFT